MSARHPNALARLADVTDPDTATSPGALFLLGIAEDIAERLEDVGSRFHADEVHEVADLAVPIPTYTTWQTWTDLALWDEDLAGLAAADADMTRRAEAALYLVAVRLGSALVAEAIADEHHAATDVEAAQ